MDEEQKRKISEGNKGQKRSEETKAKMREAWKNRPPMSEETRQKIAQSNKGKGHPHTEEEKRKISEAQKGKPRPYASRPRSEETKRKLSEAKKGVKRGPLSEEWRRKISEAGKGHVKSEETRKKTVKTRASRHPTEREIERSRKIGLSNRGRKRSDEEYANWVRAMDIVRQKSGPTGIEIAIARVLDALEIEYEEQKPMGRYIVDFFVPRKNLIIECDGYYWHNKPGAKEKDERKDAWLIEHGYTVLRLPERQIKDGNFDALTQALLE